MPRPNLWPNRAEYKLENQQDHVLSSGHVPPSLFDQASKIHVKATESGSNDQELVKKGIEYLEKCEEMISKLGLFSSNETKEDISTTNFKCILVPFYLAELAEKILQDDRIQILKDSQANL
ncbi:hypothetical protein OIU76_001034 [Salix suchowensis]|nr:hypothetical protein OIU76_001034 [Salix suchowensis]